MPQSVTVTTDAQGIKGEVVAGASQTLPQVDPQWDKTVSKKTQLPEAPPTYAQSLQQRKEEVCAQSQTARAISTDVQVFQHIKEVLARSQDVPPSYAQVLQQKKEEALALSHALPKKSQETVAQDTAIQSVVVEKSAKKGKCALQASIWPVVPTHKPVISNGSPPLCTVFADNQRRNRHNGRVGKVEKVLPQPSQPMLA